MNLGQDHKVCIIAAIAEDRGIGRRNELLCHISEDLKQFKRLTMGGTVVMGRKTFESLPGGALKGRRNIVVSRSAERKYEGVEIASSIGEAMRMVRQDERVWIIGGASIYKELMGAADELYITRIHATFEQADKYFPEIDSEVWMATEREEHLPSEGNPYAFAFVKYERRETMNRMDGMK